jgi:hypothetical protein
MPWLGRQYNEHFNPAELTCPCCRNSITTIRYSYRPGGSYSTLDITTNFHSRYVNPWMAPMPIYFNGVWSSSIAVYNHHFGPQLPRPGDPNRPHTTNIASRLSNEIAGRSSPATPFTQDSNLRTILRTTT